MEPRCPNGQTLEQGVCWSKCPPQMSQLASNPSQCVVNVPCPATVTRQDVADASVCTKVVFPVNACGNCSSASLTQWMPGECLANCPPGFIDNGSSCLKRTQDRMYSTPTCGSFYYHFDGNACQLNSTASMAWYAAVIFLFIGILVLLYKLLAAPTECAPKTEVYRYNSRFIE